MTRWIASYRTTSKTPAQDAAISSPSMLEAAREFASRRAALGIPTYYSVTFEQVDDVTAGDPTGDPASDHASDDPMGPRLHSAGLPVEVPRAAIVTVTPLHEYFSPDHLDHVVEKMRSMGQPRIRAYFDDVSNAWYAMEGTHRLRAAMLLGVAPVMVPVPWPRTRKALERARHAALRRGHAFARVDVACVP